ncbi:MAG: transposase [Candidatus Entotheonellia bacterium]
MNRRLPQAKASPRGGRPRVAERRCVEGILWSLWTGAPWRELPRRDGSPRTCWCRLKQWEAMGVLLTRWRAFLAQLNDQQKLRWDACVAEGRFIPATKGGPKSARPRGARALRWEPTWTRRPRRKSRSSTGRALRSPSGGWANLDAPQAAQAG